MENYQKLEKIGEGTDTSLALPYAARHACDG